MDQWRQHAPLFHVKHLPCRNHGRAVLRSALTATHVPPLRPDVALHATMQGGLLTRRSSSERQQAIRSQGSLLMRSRGYLSQISTDCPMGRARSRPIDFLTRVLRQHHSKRICLMRMQHQSVAHDLSLQSTFPAVSRETRTQSTHHLTPPIRSAVAPPPSRPNTAPTLLAPWRRRAPSSPAIATIGLVRYSVTRNPP